VSNLFMAQYEVRLLQVSTRKHARMRVLHRQIDRLTARLQGLARRSDQLSSVRLLIAVVGAIALIGSPFVGGPRLFAVVAVLIVIAFGIAVAAHLRVRRGIDRYDTWRRIKATHLARMTLDWEHMPPALDVTPLPEHPFETDLDMTGPHSLHHLIDTATSREGGEHLRAWLLTTRPDPAKTRDRTRQVQRLARMSRFRDKLTLNARLASKGVEKRWEASRLLHWMNSEDGVGVPGGLPVLYRRLWVLFGLSAFNVAVVVANLTTSALRPFWILSILGYLGLLLYTMSQSGDLLDQALALEDVLARLRAVLGHLERANYPPELRDLVKPLTDPVNRPSKHLRRIGWIASAVSLKQNPILALLIHAVIPWDVLFAVVLIRYKAVLAARLPAWLEVWYELEALCSLATFADLNPEYTFADLVEPQAQPIFMAKAIGHPLLPDDRKICNDFTLDSCGNLVIVTGSNMAGKSSFLRTLGVNLSLAYAGGPVNADLLRTVPFRLFSCIRVSDSVTDGFSYFYAEVRRLKALLNALDADAESQPAPLFFLIDEIFRGTNNRERLIGSRAYIHALVNQRGVGIISTHDLELIKLADEMPSIHNMHFREEVHDGRMVFDYTLRAGPCPTTNALRIMALEGLPVTEADRV